MTAAEHAPAGHDALARAWREQARWSRTAGKLKASLTLWRSVVLVSLVAGAVLETLALQFDDGTAAQQTLAWAGAVALAAVPVARVTKIDRDSITRWTRARSASEGIKQIVYGFLTGTGDYRGAGASQQLAEHLDSLLAQVKDLEVHATRVEPEDRPVPAPLTLAEYLEKRVNGQAEGYYRARAEQLAGKASRLRAVEFWLGLLAAVLAAVAAIGPGSLGAWVAVLTTIGGTLLAHREGSRYEHDVVGYAATAHRLESLHDKWSAKLRAGPLTPAEQDALVDESEEAISVENGTWMAAWADAPLV